MAFATFSAQGRVKSIENKSTRAGKDFTVLVLDVGNERYPHELEATAWHDAAEACSGIREGDEVSVSGRLESPLNERGYRNTRVTAQAVNVVAHARNPNGFASGMYDSPVATTPPKRPANEVYDESIPF